MVGLTDVCADSPILRPRGARRDDYGVIVGQQTRRLVEGVELGQQELGLLSDEARRIMEHGGDRVTESPERQPEDLPMDDIIDAVEFIELCRPDRIWREDEQARVRIAE